MKTTNKKLSAAQKSALLTVATFGAHHYRGRVSVGVVEHFSVEDGYLNSITVNSLLRAGLLKSMALENNTRGGALLITPAGLAVITQESVK
jgi:hypothetical protein